MQHDRLPPITGAMDSTALSWEATLAALAALLPLVGRRVWVTTIVDEWPVSAFGGVLERVEVDDVQPSGTEVAELSFDHGAHVLLRRDEHAGSAVDADGALLRVEMAVWALELEPAR